MSNSETVTPSQRGERTLATITAVLAVVSFLCLMSVLIAPVFGVNSASSTSWFWPVALLLAWWGLPLSVVGVVAVVLLSLRANRTRK